MSHAYGIFFFLNRFVVQKLISLEKFLSLYLPSHLVVQVFSQLHRCSDQFNSVQRMFSSSYFSIYIRVSACITLIFLFGVRLCFCLFVITNTPFLSMCMSLYRTRSVILPLFAFSPSFPLSVSLSHTCLSFTHTNIYVCSLCVCLSLSHIYARTHFLSFLLLACSLSLFHSHSLVSSSINYSQPLTHQHIRTLCVSLSLSLTESHSLSLSRALSLFFFPPSPSPSLCRYLSHKRSLILSFSLSFSFHPVFLSVSLVLSLLFSYSSTHTHTLSLCFSHLFFHSLARDLPLHLSRARASLALSRFHSLFHPFSLPFSLCAASQMWVRHRSMVIVPPEGGLKFSAGLTKKIVFYSCHG